MIPATDIADAQEALRRAQEARLEVAKLRNKTHGLADQAGRLLAENHLAERLRRAFS